MTEWVPLFAELCQKTHTEQAKWFLNGFWAEGMQDKSEEIWTFTNLFIELETGRKVLYGSKKNKIEEKCDLDELQAHQFLEKLGEVLTVKQLRTKLKKLDIDSNNRLCISEYLLSKYGKTPQALVDSPQGGVDPEVLDDAQKKCDVAEELLNLATEAAKTAKDSKIKAKTAADNAAQSLATAEKAASVAKEALENSNAKAADAALALDKSNLIAEEAKSATKAQEEEEAKLKQIQAEVRAAVNALESEEKAYNDKLKKLEDKLSDSSLSTVKRGSFVQQLAQLKGEDPLPLRKAKITQGAALKKQKRISKKAEKVTEACKTAQSEAEVAARESAEAKTQADSAAEASAVAKKEADSTANDAAEAKKEADATAKEAEKSAQAAQDSVEEAESAFNAAGEFLIELKNKDEPPKGSLWWMERILEEKRKFMPRRKKK